MNDIVALQFSAMRLFSTVAYKVHQSNNSLTLCHVGKGEGLEYSANSAKT